jgi:hypothetical protein
MGVQKELASFQVARQYPQLIGMMPNYNDKYADIFMQTLYSTDPFIKKLVDQKQKWIEGKSQMQWNEYASSQIKENLKEYNDEKD